MKEPKIVVIDATVRRLVEGVLATAGLSALVELRSTESSAIARAQTLLLRDSVPVVLLLDAATTDGQRIALRQSALDRAVLTDGRDRDEAGEIGLRDEILELVPGARDQLCVILAAPHLASFLFKFSRATRRPFVERVLDNPLRQEQWERGLLEPSLELERLLGQGVGLPEVATRLEGADFLHLAEIPPFSQVLAFLKRFESASKQAA